MLSKHQTERNHEVLVTAATNKAEVPPKLLPISSFEQIYALSFVVDAIWVFEDKLDLNKLKLTLSKILDSYPECSGRFTTDGKLSQYPRGIELNDKGVPFKVQYERNKSIKETIKWNRHKYQNKIQIPSLVHLWHMYKVTTGSAAPLTVCVTYFSDGTALGVSASHGIFDGDAYYTFVTNWSNLYKGASDLGEYAPTNDRSVLPNKGHCEIEKLYIEIKPKPKDIDSKKEEKVSLLSHAVGPQEDAQKKKAQSTKVVKKYLKELGRTTDSWTISKIKCAPGFIKYGNTFTKRFAPLWMSPEALKSIKSAVEAEAKAKFGTKFISLNEAISAHLAACSQSLFNLPAGKKINTITLINWRERIEGLPRNFAGNAISASKTSDFLLGKPTTSKDDMVYKRAEIATKIHDTLRKFADTPSPFLQKYASDDLLGFQNRIMPVDWEIPDLLRNLKPSNIWTNNFVKYPVYESDFGAKCVWVAPQYTVDMFIIWPAPPSVGGLYIIPQGLAAIALNKINHNHQAPFWSEFAMFEPNVAEAVKNISGPKILGQEHPW